MNPLHSPEECEFGNKSSEKKFGEVAMRKSIPALRQVAYESISDLPGIQKSYREKALVVIPQAVRICATSNGEQRVQVLILVVQGLSLAQKLRQLMQEYFELVDWQRLKLPSAERRQRDSLKSFERSVELWKDWIRLKNELATLDERAASSGIVTSQAQETESRSNEQRRKQGGIWTKSASRGQHVGFLVMSTDTVSFGKF